VCICAKGYEANATDADQCINVDECTAGTDNCGANTNCSDKSPVEDKEQFSCPCIDGYKFIDSSLLECEDVDECAATLSPCGENEACANTVGGFACSCVAGYIQDSTSTSNKCIDIEECSFNFSPCNKNAKCTEEPGSYSCSCNAGYGGDGILCFDIDECVTGNIDTKAPVCNETVAYCTNIEPPALDSDGFTCTCKSGWESNNGTDCQDVDECLLPKNNSQASNCPADSKCINNDGGYECKCSSGYEAVNGGTCKDINECYGNLKSDGLVEKLHACDLAASCFNQPGNYTCTCPPGWEDTSGDGTQCTQPDWCIDQTACAGGPCCDADAGCTDTRNPARAEYACSCNSGFLGTGLPGECENVDECALHKHNCQGVGVKQCVDTPGSFTCKCCDGGVCGVDDVEGADAYMWNSASARCERDLCATGRHECDVRAECTQSSIDATTSCECTAGWVGDGKVCEDEDECNTERHTCHEEANCVNTIGSFNCTCKQGWEGDGVECNGTTTTALPFDASTTAYEATAAVDATTTDAGFDLEGSGDASGDASGENVSGDNIVSGMGSGNQTSESELAFGEDDFDLMTIVAIVIGGQMACICIWVFFSKCCCKKSETEKSNEYSNQDNFAHNSDYYQTRYETSVC
jgi:hypothetical protein